MHDDGVFISPGFFEFAKPKSEWMRFAGRLDRKVCLLVVDVCVE